FIFSIIPFLPVVDYFGKPYFVIRLSVTRSGLFAPRAWIPSPTSYAPRLPQELDTESCLMLEKLISFPLNYYL
ncbi:MAG: hypothetical protein ACLP29_09020, partial [Dissulfurispiraceae bacterium]